MAAQRWNAASWLVKVGGLFAPLSLVFFAIEQRSFLASRLDRGQAPGRDFLNFWTGARLLLQGKAHDVFVQSAYDADLVRIWGAGLAPHSFFYPPSLFPFIAWTGPLPYGVALALWSLIGVGALFAVTWPYSKRPLLAILILLSPAVVVCLDDGQNGLITAALIVGGFRLADRRPLLAGVLIGLATFKPQLGLLIPMALLAAWRWRVIAGAALSACALFTASILIAGVDAWRLYIVQAASAQRFLSNATGMFENMMPTPFMAGRLAGLPLAGSYAVQIVVTLVCAAVVIARFLAVRHERRGILPMDILILVTAGLLASPYAFNYDMASVAVALLLVDRAQPALSRSAAWRWAVVALWSAPIFMMLAPFVFGRWGLADAPVGPVMLVVGFALVLVAARREIGSEPSEPTPV